MFNRHADITPVLSISLCHPTPSPALLKKICAIIKNYSTDFSEYSLVLSEYQYGADRMIRIVGFAFSRRGVAAIKRKAGG